MTNPTDIEFTASSFGGGWLVPKTDDGREIGELVIGEEPYALVPLGGVLGWIVEPCDAEELICALRDSGATVRTA